MKKFNDLTKKVFQLNWKRKNLYHSIAGTPQDWILHSTSFCPRPN